MSAAPSLLRIAARSNERVHHAIAMLRVSDIVKVGAPTYDSALWHRRKGRLVRRLLRMARTSFGNENTSQSNTAASCSCTFLLSNGATASSFSTATPP
jgi:hypothetical protein